MSADPTMIPVACQRRQNGNAAVPSGTTLDVESGGVLAIAGTDRTAQLLAAALGSGGTAYGTVAATGSIQGDAAAITSDFALVTGADGTKGVILPTPVAGQQVLVKNNTAAVLKVYPTTGGAINAIAANGAISMASLTSAVFAASSATQWFTCPLLPS